MESVEEIRKMLDRFYLGETTLGEEKRLYEYFSSHKVPEEFLPDKDLFQTLGNGDQTVPVPGDLNQKIIDSIDQLDKKATRTRRISVFSLSGLAAGLLVMIAVYLFYIRTDSSPMLASSQMEDTYDDPLEAYEEAKRTLAYVSAKLNNGTSELEQVQKHVSKSADPLKSLSKINKGSKELSLLGQLQRVREFDR
jgi:hypothetical protein